jgi:acetyl esterase/lipase
MNTKPLVALLVVTAIVITRAVSAADVIEVLRDVPYAQRETGPLNADFYLPRGDGPFPGVLVVHGGAWFLGNKNHMAYIGKLLAEEGFVAMSINYRLAPHCQFPSQIDDCKAAVRFLREHAEKYHVDPDRIAGYGYSAGGQLVALLGALPDDEAAQAGAAQKPISTRLQAVVAGGAPCDFRQLPESSPQLAYWLGGCRKDKPEAYEYASAASFVSPNDPPMLFYHGEADTLVSIASPKAMAAALSAAGVQTDLYTVAGAGHIKAFRDAGAAAESIKFLKSHLGRHRQPARNVSAGEQDRS